MKSAMDRSFEIWNGAQNKNNTSSSTAASSSRTISGGKKTAWERSQEIWNSVENGPAAGAAAHAAKYKGPADQNYVDRYFKDYNNYVSEAYKALDGFQWGQADELYNSYVLQNAEMNARAKEASKWLEANKWYYSGEDYKAMSDSLKQMQQGQDDIMDAWTSRWNAAKEYGSAEEYNEAMRIGQIYADPHATISGLEGQIQKNLDEIAALEDMNSRWYGKDSYGDSEGYYRTLQNEQMIREREEALPGLRKQLEEAQGILQWYESDQKNAKYLPKYEGKPYSELSAILETLPDGEEKDWLTAYAKSQMTVQDYDDLIARYEAELKTVGDNPDPHLSGYDQYLREEQQISDINRWLEEAKTGKWNAEHAEQYNALRQNADFAALSLPNKTEKNTMYRYINDIGNTREWVDGSASSTAIGIFGKQEQRLERYQRLEDSERQIYNYLYATAGEKAAMEYLDYLTPQLNERQNAIAAQEAAKFAEDIPVLSDLYAIGAQLSSGTGYLDILGQKAVKEIREAVTGEYAGPIDYNTPAMRGNTVASAIRGYRSEQLNEKYGTIQLDPEKHPVLGRMFNGKGWGDAYQLGMSSLDSATVALLSPVIGPTGLLLLGGSAATQATLDAAERGATDGQALTMGLLAGGFEMLFEKIPFERLVGESSEKILKSILQQGLTEGMEEAGTTVANAMADIIVMADNSKYRQEAAALMADGKSSNQAWLQVLGGIAAEAGYDFLGGVISGAPMGGISTAAKNNARRKQEAAINAAMEALQVQERSRAAAAVTAETVAKTKATASIAQKDAPVQIGGENAGTVKGLAYRDGKVVVEVVDENGAVRSENRSNLTLDKGTDELIAFAEQYGEAAPAIYAAYDGEKNLGDYLNAAEYILAGARGSVGVNGQRFLAHLKNVDNAITKGMMTQEIELLYNAGRSIGIKNQSLVKRGSGTLTWSAKTQRTAITGKQKAAVRFLQDLAKITGFDIEVFESEKNEAGEFVGEQGSYVDGRIRIDLNAGLNSVTDSIENTAMLRTASHEITHWFKDASPDAYFALRNFMIDHLAEYKGRTLDQLVMDKIARSKGKNLSYDAALDEVVADGCEMILRDSNMVRKLGETNRGLFNKVKDWLKNWLRNLKKAFEGTETVHHESRYLMENFAEEMVALWDEALKTSVENTGGKVQKKMTVKARAAQKADPGNKKTSGQSQLADAVQINENGETVAASRESAIKRSERIVDQMKRSMDSIMAMESVASINAGNAVPFFGSRNENYTAGGKVFKTQGSLAIRKGYGTVQLTVNGAKESVFHGNGPAKQATFPAIKAVIERGIEVGRDYNHNGKGFDTVTFAAPIDFFGHKEALGVVVKEFNNAVGEKNFYIHEICDENGNYIQLENGIVTVKEKVAPARPNPKSAASATYEGNIPKMTISHSSVDVNENSESKSEREIPLGDPDIRYSERDSLTEEIVSLERRIEELKSENATTAKETTTAQKTSDKQKRIEKLERDLRYTETRIGTLQGEELAAAELKAGNLRAQIRKLKRAVNQEIARNAELATQMRLAGQAGKEVRRMEERLEKLQADLAKTKEAVKTARGEERQKAERKQRNLEAQIKKLNKDHAQALKNAELASDSYVARQVSNEVRKLEKRLEELKARQDQRAADARERKSTKKYRDRITEKVFEMEKLLFSNSEKYHVPDALRVPLANFLQTIDFTSDSVLRGKEATARDRREERAIAALQQIVRGAEGADGEQIETFLPDELQEAVDRLVHKAEEITSRSIDSFDNTDGYYSLVNRMDADALQDLDFALGVLLKTIKEINSVYSSARYQSVAEMANDTIDDLRSMPQYVRKGDRAEKRSAKLNWNNATPEYAFRRFGEAGRAIMDGLWSGQEKFALLEQQILDKRNEIASDKTVREWSKKTVTVKLSSGDVEMPAANAMMLYILMRRDKALEHLTTGGFRLQNMQDADAHLVYYNDLGAVENALSKEQLAAAKALQDYMTKQGGAWGNEISMARWGFKQFTESHYAPIVTDSSELAQDKKSTVPNTMNKILHQSFTKTTRPNAQTVVLVGNIFDVFANHMTDMAKYNSMALPVWDALRWFNYADKTKHENKAGIMVADKSRNVRNAMQYAYGDEAVRYVRTLLQDINGESEGGRTRGDNAMQKFTSRYKAASVAGNLRVILQQPTSYFRAGAAIDPKWLIIGANPARLVASYKEMMKHSGIAVWKAMGFRDINVGVSIRDQISGTKKAGQVINDKIMNIAMKGAEWADALTWAELWTACRAEQRSAGKAGQELMEATAKRFGEVVRSTQVVDSVLTKSQIMRSSNPLDATLTAFMSEPTVSYNMLLDAVFSFETDKRKTDRSEAWKKNRKKIARAFLAFTATTVLNAAAQSLGDAIRDDDEYQKFWEKFLEALLPHIPKGNPLTTEGWLEDALDQGNLVAGMNPLNLVPGWHKFLLNEMKGYTGQSMDRAALANAVKFGAILGEAIAVAKGWQENPTKTTYYGNMTWFGVTMKGLQAVSQFSGYPVYNITRDAVAIWNSVCAPFFGDVKVRSYDPGDTARIVYAMQDGFLTKEEAMEELLAAGVSEGDAYAAINKALTGSKYGGLANALITGDGYDQAVDELKASGLKNRDIESRVRGYVKEWLQQKPEDGKSYSGHRIDEKQARSLLQEYGGLDEDEIDALLLEWSMYTDIGYDYDKLSEYVADGTFNEAEVEELLMAYGGVDEETAPLMAQAYRFRAEHDGFEHLSYQQIDKYLEFCDPAGVALDVYDEVREAISEMESDKDRSGETISGSKKKKIVKYIRSLELPFAQKKALWNALKGNMSDEGTPW